MNKKELSAEIPLIQGERITLRRLCASDAGGLRELAGSPAVYRYLPIFLYEKKYQDIDYVIEHLYDECLQESLILGIFEKEEFCGLFELYGCQELTHKVSIGYRLLERCWGRGIAAEAARLVTEYLFLETDITTISASTMIENKASANVLRKNGFTLTAHAVCEDWGYDEPTLTDKWILTKPQS